MNISRLDNAINELETCKILEVFTGIEGHGRGVRIDSAIIKSPKLIPKIYSAFKWKAKRCRLKISTFKNLLMNF